MNSDNKTTPAFSDKCIVNATYRTGGGIYYRIVAIVGEKIRVQEMNATGPVQRYANYTTKMFEMLFRQNCTWCLFAFNEEMGRYVDLARSASVKLGLERYLVKQ